MEERDEEGGGGGGGGNERGDSGEGKAEGVKEEGEVGGGRGKGVSLCKSNTPLAPMDCLRGPILHSSHTSASMYGFSRRGVQRGC